MKKKSEIEFNSEKEIENYYRKEKQKANNLLKEIEKKKAVSLVNITQKQIERLRIEKHNLEIMHQDLTNHLKNISKKIKQLSNEKEIDAKNIKDSSNLKRILRRLEKEADEIRVVRKNLADKEKILIDRMNKLVNVNKDKFKVSNRYITTKLLNTERKKEKILEDARNLLKEERFNMYLDNSLLDSLGKFAIFKIKRLNKKLKDLKKARVEVLKQLQLLKISEEKAQEKIRYMQKKLESIKRKYRKVLSNN
ncbi:MAG: hypothetical protein QXW97_04340 [Candidatus Pacearchaeota archaeon]